MDHLLDLDEELDLADAAASALEVEARAKGCALGEMVADPRGNLADLVDHAEIERAAPHERLDRRQETLPEGDVAGARLRPDERCPLPRQSRRFVMRYRGI